MAEKLKELRSNPFGR